MSRRAQRSPFAACLARRCCAGNLLRVPAAVSILTRCLVATLAACAPDAGPPVETGVGRAAGTAPAVPVGIVPAGAEARSPGAAASAWREALELDLPGEVVADGLGRVLPGGAFANDGVCVALVARALFATGREREAHELLERSAVTLAAEHVDIARAWLATEADDLDRALRLLTPPAESGAATLHPLVPQCWLVHGRAHARKGELDRARPFLQRFVELAPRDPEAPAALHLLAEQALSAGDEERGLGYERMAVELGRWHAYHNARRLQIREQPDAPLPRLGLGQLWLAAGENARAREVLRDLTERHPDYARGWALLGDAFQQNGDLDLAGEAWDEALQLDPELDETRLNRARLALLDERPADARRDLERLVDGPTSGGASLAPAHLLLARLLFDAGETEAARARYGRYRQLGGTEPLE